MDAYRLNVKLYLETGDGFSQQSLIPIFHRWIRDRELGDELLVDVADYQHVPDGPGVMLIGHQVHYAVDEMDGRPGLVYARKRPASGSFAERLRAAFGSALRAARKLEREPSLDNLKIPGDRLALRIDDRLLAPDSDETFAAVEPELRALLTELYGGAEFRLRRAGDRGGGFGVQVEADVGPVVAALLERV
ncbi:MAG: hypothetical protein V3T72_03210 [Thermoanaerobaculia bacterium]